MKIAYLAAGAGGMYCGSCIHDNTLAAAMMRQGHEVALVPTYTPLKTDEENVGLDRVFYGAVNVYLQQQGALFRHLPGFLHRWLDRPGLISWITRRFSSSTDAVELGPLTLSVLQGEHGAQAQELETLVKWLADDFRPDVVQITNSLLLGLAGEIRRRVGVPVVVQVQGEDIFLDDLSDEWRRKVVAEMRRRARDADLFMSPSRYYAEHMGELLEVPAERFAVVPLGIRLDAHDRSLGAGRERPEGELTIGYLARICPEKGLHLLVDAFRLLAARPGFERLRLKVAGWLGGRDRAYLEGLRAKIDGWGLGDRFEHVGEVDLAGKTAFLESLDVLSVPTIYREPKGLFALEAMAHRVPVVLPRHGSFPEMIEATGGGILVDPGSAQSLAAGLEECLANRERRRKLGERGFDSVHSRFTAESMAATTLEVYERLLGKTPESPRPAAPAGETKP